MIHDLLTINEVVVLVSLLILVVLYEIMDLRNCTS